MKFADQHEQPCAVWLRCCLCGKLERDFSFVASYQNQRDVGTPPGGTPAISRTWYQLSGLMLTPQSTAAAFSIGNDRFEMSDGSILRWEASVHEQCTKRDTAPRREHGCPVVACSRYFLSCTFPFTRSQDSEPLIVALERARRRASVQNLRECSVAQRK